MINLQEVRMSEYSPSLHVFLTGKSFFHSLVSKTFLNFHPPCKVLLIHSPYRFPVVPGYAVDQCSHLSACDPAFTTWALPPQSSLFSFSLSSTRHHTLHKHSEAARTLLSLKKLDYDPTGHGATRLQLHEALRSRAQERGVGEASHRVLESHQPQSQLLNTETS